MPDVVPVRVVPEVVVAVVVVPLRLVAVVVVPVRVVALVCVFDVVWSDPDEEEPDRDDEEPSDDESSEELALLLEGSLRRGMLNVKFDVNALTDELAWIALFPVFDDKCCSLRSRIKNMKYRRGIGIAQIIKHHPFMNSGIVFVL